MTEDIYFSEILRNWIPRKPGHPHQLSMARHNYPVRMNIFNKYTHTDSFY